MITIGTPLSPNTTQGHAARLRRTRSQVLIALQRLGVETIAVDRYENAPGQRVAHRADHLDDRPPTD